MSVKYTLSGNRLEVVSYPTIEKKPNLFDWQMFKKYCPDEYEQYMDEVSDKKIGLDVDELVEMMIANNLNFVSAIETKTKQITEIDKIQNSLRSAKRAERKLSRLVNCNLNHHSKQQFITLTFAEEIEDRELAFHYFDLFRRRVMRKCPEFKYIGVTEIQNKRLEKTGKAVIHFHLIAFNSPFKSNKKGYTNKELDKMWKYGRTDCQKIKDEKVAFYLIKYLSKDVVTAREINKRRYFTSKSLLQPLVYKDIQEYVSGVVGESTLQYEAEIEHDFMGMIRYRNYILTDEQSEMFKRFANLSIS